MKSETPRTRDCAASSAWPNDWRSRFRAAVSSEMVARNLSSCESAAVSWVNALSGSVAPDAWAFETACTAAVRAAVSSA
ncbi:Uncharacterised protein [Mycobacteroides abscessus subsp. abscessus]|nr:Uncharacterised protein [Mycobacteroides abscessus subsp. abscessus]